MKERLLTNETVSTPTKYVSKKLFIGLSSYSWQDNTLENTQEKKYKFNIINQEKTTVDF
jgi:hypothetical protein